MYENTKACEQSSTTFVRCCTFNIKIIIFLGTPGVGKSTIARLVADRTKFAWREVSKLAEEYNCLDEYDVEYQCPVLNEDKVHTFFFS